MRRFFALAVLFAIVIVSGCGPNAPTGQITVGVLSDLRPGTDFDQLSVKMSVNGNSIESRTLAVGGANPQVDIPAEFSFESVRDGDEVRFELEARLGSELRVQRTLRTRAVANRHLLARIRIESLCALSAPLIDDQAPNCEAPEQTCIAGSCRTSFVEPDTLEEYWPDWGNFRNDPCKPAGAGEPIVLLGEGQTDYFPMADDAVAAVEAGPQGGHHIWVAARIKNLHRAGSITSVSGTIDELNLEIPPLKVIFTMELDEGGYCKLYGLRFQLDIAGDDIQTMLGKRLKVKVEIRDVSGTVGTAERWVRLSDTII